MEEILALRMRVQDLEAELSQVRIGEGGTGVSPLGTRVGIEGSGTASNPLLRQTHHRKD